MLPTARKKAVAPIEQRSRHNFARLPAIRRALPRPADSLIATEHRRGSALCSEPCRGLMRQGIEAVVNGAIEGAVVIWREFEVWPINKMRSLPVQQEEELRHLNWRKSGILAPCCQRCQYDPISFRKRSPAQAPLFDLLSFREGKRRGAVSCSGVPSADFKGFHQFISNSVSCGCDRSCLHGRLAAARTQKASQ